MNSRPSGESRMQAAAVQAMARAHAPYSGFRVGAALLTPDGTVIAGCNVENSSYSAGLCAERAAVAAAVSLGHREFAGLMLVTEADEPSPPCGICRQVLVEFAPDLPITSRTTSGAEARWSLADLLPHPFTPQSLHQT